MEIASAYCNRNMYYNTGNLFYLHNTFVILSYNQHSVYFFLLVMFNSDFDESDTFLGTYPSDLARHTCSNEIQR